MHPIIETKNINQTLKKLEQQEKHPSCEYQSASLQTPPYHQSLLLNQNQYVGLVVASEAREFWVLGESVGFGNIE